MTNFLRQFPRIGELLSSPIPDSIKSIGVNSHIHTPYSFSAFSDVESIFRLAVEEDIRILGINDFNTTSGYLEFHNHAVKNKVFPMFNIEFIALDRVLQKNGIRVNDPNNPGRTYFSGKGLDFPVTMDSNYISVVETVKAESLRHVATMINKINSMLADCNSDLHMDYTDIRKNYAKDLLRERHIAKALRILVFKTYPKVADRNAFLSTLYGKEPLADPESNTAVENEIRNNLLKAGGQAFVEEDEKAFLSVDAVIEIITNAGGIPCYPVLLDDSKGKITSYEADKEALYENLSGKNIFCIELIPGRNDAAVLNDFVHFFHSKGFIVLFGTEHNSPDMIPLTVSCRNKVPLSDELKAIGFEGACTIVAHEYFRAMEPDSQVFRWNELNSEQKRSIIDLGKAVVYHFLNN
jgi:hypothetical protein